MATMETPRTSGADNFSILASLEPGQLTHEKRRQVPRRLLRPSQMFLLWSVRLYLLFMLAVVVYQVWAGA